LQDKHDEEKKRTQKEFDEYKRKVIFLVTVGIDARKRIVILERVYDQN
jgi:hypothetical protein